MVNQEDLNCIGEGQYVGVLVCVRGKNMWLMWYYIHKVVAENEETSRKYAKQSRGKFIKFSFTGATKSEY